MVFKWRVRLFSGDPSLKRTFRVWYGIAGTRVTPLQLLLKLRMMEVAVTTGYWLDEQTLKAAAAASVKRQD